MNNPNPVAIITGASRGIGKAVAEYFASKKYNVVLVARNKEKLEALAKGLSANGITALHYATDVSDAEQAKHACEEVKSKLGRIDVLFNNAGIVNFGTSEMTPDKFDEVTNINLKGAYNWIYNVVPHMKEQKSGYILNLSSRAALFPNPGTGVYALTKAGLLAYSYSLMRELLPHNVKVTSLCPGAVDTDILNGYKMDRNKIIPTQDIVKIVDFLLSLSPNASIPEILIDDTNSPFLNVKAYNKENQD